MVDLRVTVEEVRGFCDFPMRPGDGFEVRGGGLVFPQGGRICLWALASLMPFLPAKQRCGDDPNDWMPRTALLSCPDPNGRVIFRVEPLGAPSRSADPEAEAAPGKMRLVTDSALCAGCRACEVACSEAHEGAYLPELSRIRIDTDDTTCTDIPRVCCQCGAAPCVRACPTGALGRDPHTGGVLLDPSRCTACGLCMKACSFGVLRRHPTTGKPLTCDLCGGNPRCVERCAPGALKVVRL